jgi:hypothetical protein
MKKIFFPLTIAILISIAFSMNSCDIVDEPYTENTDVSDCPVPTFPEVTNPQKTILIEEFTGHTCVYCPYGTYMTHLIQEEPYGDKVVIMAIHASGLAEPELPDFPIDLRPLDNIGEIFYSDFGVNAEPRAMFNREKLDGTNYFYSAPDTWKTKAETVLAEAPVISLQIINNYDDVSKKLCTHIRTKFLSANNQNLKIATFITEDSIIGNQENNNSSVGTTPIIHDYVFMDVLRCGLKGAYGEVLTTGNVEADSSVIRTYKRILETNWKAKNCKVISYVYDESTKAILQVCEKHVVE